MVHLLRRLLTCTAAAVLIVSGGAQAGEDDYARVNAVLAEHHVAPRYATLATATKTFAAAVDALCSRRPPRDPGPARDAFGAALDAWGSVQHVRHGPVELLMRGFRIHFWPDRRGRGARQLRQLLEQRSDAVLAPDAFRAASVAVQGFPAAERLLFDEQAVRRIASAAEGDYACRLLAAVAGNIAEMAAGMEAGWSGGAQPFVAEIRNAGRGAGRFASHREATAAFVKGLHTSLAAMADYKLDAPLGTAIGSARPRLAETWRSGRSLDNIVSNLEGMRAMYEGEGGPGLRSLLGPGDAALAGLLSRAFVQTLATARSIALPLSRAVAEPAARPAVETLAREVRALKELVSGRLAPALGTPLGFNALDGD